ncbi:synaptotagmin-15-like [Argiope bruennichi]|uniref:synaptotagmin-15-like n=1 Tax=Argiope bruennichi TaxID=94029 RepID=UPI0024958DC5|nr:synaptotagmin-15-like [Argiope bruennichi]
MTTDMNVNRSYSEILRRPISDSSDNGFYLWLIVGCSLGGVLLLTIMIALLMYIRRRIRLSKKGTDLLDSSYIPGSEFCPQQMISSFSSSTSDDVSDSQAPIGKQFRRPLGPSSSLDPTSLLKLTSECVQPRPALTRWHTVATPHCQTTAVLGTLDAERDSDEEESHNPPCLHGRLWFSLLYNSEDNRLEVTLIKAKYLPGRGLVNAPRDPFVKVFLLPDEENFHQSKIRKRTLTPKFNETFEFKVSPDDLPNRTLKLSVYDVDKRKVRHCLGHVLFPLTKNDMMSGDTMWRDLELAIQPAAHLGDLQLCLSCNPYSNRIKATVCRLRNLKGITSDDAVLYVKVQLYHGRKMIKSKRTVPQSVSSQQAELIFDETFSFGVSGRFFDSCSFTFSVMLAGSSPMVKDTVHGKVVIGPFMYARGEQLQHWQEMLSNPRNMVMRWHSLEAPKRV